MNNVKTEYCILPPYLTEFAGDVKIKVLLIIVKIQYLNSRGRFMKDHNWPYLVLLLQSIIFHQVLSFCCQN